MLRFWGLDLLVFRGLVLFSFTVFDHLLFAANG